MYNQGINVPINLNLSELQSKLSTTATDRRKWPLWRDGRYGEVGGGVQYDTCCAVFFFLGGGWWVEYNMFIFQVHAYCTLQWQSNHK